MGLSLTAPRCLTTRESQVLLGPDYERVLTGFERICKGQTLDVKRFQTYILAPFPSMV